MAIRIGILNPNGLELSAQRALDKLVNAFGQQNIQVRLCLYTDQIPKADLLIGTYEKSPFLKDLVDKGQVPLPLAPEALFIQELTIGEHTALWACAYDTRGLLYALYELTERINAQSVPALYKAVREEPAFQLRGVLHFLPQEELKNGWVIERSYWESYFEMLVQNRFNCFTLVFNPSSGTPLFPYLLSVPEHPEVSPFHISEELRGTNLRALKELAELATESGLIFHLGLWNFYPGHSPLSFRVSGLNQENIGDYLFRALKQLLFACPEIKGLDFKFQPIPLEPDFALKTIIQAVLETGNTINLKLYVNQITAEIIDLLQVSETNAFLTTEAWGGKCGLPYLKAEEDGDRFFSGLGLKIKPAFQLTTPSVFPWGDPDYFQQLFPTLKTTGFDSFQLVAPGSRKGEVTPVLPREIEPTVQWEFERHWYQFHLCGRLSYHPGTTGEVLIRDFHRRFGEKGNDLAELYRLTGKVLPLFNAVHGGLSSLPEFNTGGLLAFYLRTPAGDPALFASYREYVRATLDRTALSKLPPPAVAQELERLGTEIREKVQNLQDLTLHTGELYTFEWEQTLKQATIVGCFALFHSAKIRAAIELALFTETKDPSCLEKAWQFLKDARFHWERLPFSARTADSRLLLLEDEKRLQILLQEYRNRGAFLIGFDFGGPPVSLPKKEEADVFSDYFIEEGFTFIHHQTAYDPEVGYGWLKTTDLRATPAPLVRLSEQDLLLTKETETNRLFPYENQLLNKMVWSRRPAAFQVDLTPGCYQIQLTLADYSPEARRHGPMQIAINDRIIAEELVVAPGKRVDLREIVEVNDGKLTLSFSCPPDQDWFISALTIHPVAPVIRHIPLISWVRGQPLAIEATVTGINPIGQVILNYQTENERGYHMIMMTPVGTDRYRARIPAVYLEQANAVNYYITALDSQGLEVSLGSFDQPFSVPVRDADTCTATFFHFPPSPEDGMDKITMKCTVRPATAVEKVTFCYESEENILNQLTMERENADEEYGVSLATPRLSPDSMLKYRFLVKFKNGDQALFPNPLTSVPYFILKTGSINHC